MRRHLHHLPDSMYEETLKKPTTLSISCDNPFAKVRRSTTISERTANSPSLLKESARICMPESSNVLNPAASVEHSLTYTTSYFIVIIAHFLVDAPRLAQCEILVVSTEGPKLKLFIKIIFRRLDR
jgi:hypothetical protein